MLHKKKKRISKRRREQKTSQSTDTNTIEQRGKGDERAAQRVPVTCRPSDHHQKQTTKQSTHNGEGKAKPDQEEQENSDHHLSVLPSTLPPANGA